MAIVTGTLRDIGMSDLDGFAPTLTFKPSENAVTPGGSLFATKPVTVTPDNTGTFTVDLAPTVDIRPPAHWTLAISWLNPDGYGPGGFTTVDFPNWKLYVPAEGGRIDQIMHASRLNPLVWYVSETPPPDPAPNTYWYDPSTGDVQKWS